MLRLNRSLSHWVHLLKKTILLYKIKKKKPLGLFKTIITILMHNFLDKSWCSIKCPFSFLLILVLGIKKLLIFLCDSTSQWISINLPLIIFVPGSVEKVKKRMKINKMNIWLRSKKRNWSQSPYILYIFMECSRLVFSPLFIKIDNACGGKFDFLR